MQAVAFDYEMTRLRNGTRVITVPMRDRQSVSVCFFVGVGSRHETEEISGLAHFIEHMVFKGTERYPTARDVSESLERVGGNVNASTDKESTNFWAKVPADHLE